MGLTALIRAAILAAGRIVPATGPRILPTGEEDYAAHIANEGAGGAHGYESLEDLAQANHNLLFTPMIAVVAEHQRPDGSHHALTMYMLTQKPAQRISQLPGELADNMAQYWKVFDPLRPMPAQTGVQMRYAPNVDARTGEASVSGGRPIFPGSAIGRAITQAEYNQLWKTNPDGSANTIMLASKNLATGTVTPVAGYWEEELDSSRHFWWSQKIPGSDNWSAPISFGSESVEANDYTATIYMWAVQKPAQPPYYLPGTGQKNNSPAGWSDRIEALRPSSEHRLWASKAQKSSTFELKSDWFPPFEISLDPELVRYSEKRTPDPNTINGGVFSEAAFIAQGWMPMITDQHRYIARRQSVNSSWFVEMMAGESGAYFDTVYKNFLLSDYDQVMNPMTAPLYRPVGKTPMGWSDTATAAGLDEITMQSSAEKYITGDLVGDWSDPVPANGQDVFFDEIRSEGGSDFLTKNGATVPAFIQLRALLSRGKSIIAAGDIAYQWRKIYNNGQIISEPVAGNDTIVVTSSDVTGMAIYEVSQEFGGTTYVSEYTVKDITDGIDAMALDIRGTSPVVLLRPDGSFVPAQIELRAFGQNLSDLNLYTWKKNGEPVMDPDNAAQVFKGDVLLVDYKDFRQGADSVTYSVHTVDGHPGDSFSVTKVSEGVGVDAITIFLDNESQVVVLDASTGTTNFAAAKTRVQVFNGITDETGSWAFAKTDLNVTSQLVRLKSASGTDIPGTQVVQVTDMGQGKTVGSVTITASKNGRTVSKVFSVARITDPVGASLAYIEPDASGFAFSPAAADTKTITARLFVNNLQLPADKFSVKWFLGDQTVAASSEHTLLLHRKQVDFSLALKLQITYLGKKLTAVRDITDVRDAFKKGKLYTTALVDAQGNPVTANDVPPASHAWNAGQVNYNGINWTPGRQGAIYETIREEYDTSWSAPVRIAGEKGEQGTATRIAKIYQWSVNEPQRPDSMELAPAGWSADTFGARPSEQHQLWLCMGDQLLTANPALLPPGWSTPVPFSGQRGLPGVGIAATVKAGQVTILGENEVPYVQNAGTANEAVFNFGIPRGPKGADGTVKGVVMRTDTIATMVGGEEKEVMAIGRLPVADRGITPPTVSGMLLASVEVMADDTKNDWCAMRLQVYTNAGSWQYRWVTLAENFTYAGHGTYSQLHLNHLGSFSGESFRITLQNRAGGGNNYRNPRFIFIPFG